MTEVSYETHNAADSHYSAGKHYWYVNVDEATVNGIELGGEFDFGKYYGWSCTIAPYLYWTHLFEFEDGEGEKLENRSQDSLSFGITYDSLALGLTAGIDATYYGEQYTSDSKELTEVGEATIFDLHLSKQIWQFENTGEVRVKTQYPKPFRRLLFRPGG